MRPEVGLVPVGDEATGKPVNVHCEPSIQLLATSSMVSMMHDRVGQPVEDVGTATAGAAGIPAVRMDGLAFHRVPCPRMRTPSAKLALQDAPMAL